MITRSPCHLITLIGVCSTCRSTTLQRELYVLTYSCMHDELEPTMHYTLQSRAAAEKMAASSSDHDEIEPPAKKPRRGSQVDSRISRDRKTFCTIAYKMKLSFMVLGNTYARCSICSSDFGIIFHGGHRDVTTTIVKMQESYPTLTQEIFITVGVQVGVVGRCGLCT